MNDSEFDQSPGNMLVPMVIETTHKGERAYDIFSRLLKDGMVFIGEGVGEGMANIICAQLLHLEAEDPDKEVTAIIQSPGGAVTAGFAIHDTLRLMRNPIKTICIGEAMSMGAFLLACSGDPGNRFVAPNASIMIHEVSSGTQGKITDQKIRLAFSDSLNLRLAKHLAKACNKTLKQMLEDMKRDYFMDADEAIAYGLADAKIESRKAKRLIVEP
jgi:ATP-dependent Clp protease protease subunit